MQSLQLTYFREYFEDFFLKLSLKLKTRFTRVLNWSSHTKKAQFTHELVK
jgi:hypothetical protein